MRHRAPITAPPPAKGRSSEPPKRARKRDFVWTRVALAAAPIGLLVYYLTVAGPAMVPVPRDVSVPFPQATAFLEDVCTWSSEHPLAVGLAGLGLLLPGMLMRFTLSRERYYTWLAIVASLTLVFVYLSISAPIDRLLEAVEDSVPQDNRVPDFRSPK